MAFTNIVPAPIEKYGVPASFTRFTIERYVKMGNNFSIDVKNSQGRLLVLNLRGGSLVVYGNSCGPGTWNVVNSDEGDGYKLLLIVSIGGSRTKANCLYFDFGEGLLHEVVYK